MKRDKKIEVRVSPLELMQIKKHFKGANISDYVSDMNNLVANRFTLSANIIKYNMYEYLLK